MKLYLIYAIIPSNVFSTRIKYLIDNVKDFKTQGNDRVGLYAWTTSKKILEEFLEGRDHDIYKVIKKEFMDDDAQEMLEELLMDDTGEDKVDAMVESEEESNEETSEN